jgi:polyhydroxyalkanoate synthesis regulator phasin
VAEQSAELIDRLLRSDKLSRETREELNEFRQQAAQGALDGGDRRYVEALASRLLGTGEVANDDRVEVEDHETLNTDLWDVGEDEELRSWRERAETAERRVTELEAEVAALKDRLDQG